MIDVDLRDVERLERELLFFARRSYPFAVRKTLNDLAWQTRKNYQEQISQKLITRNQFTMRSVLVDRATGVSVPRMRSVAGSIAPYMDIQEFGGVDRGGPGKNKPIATGYSAGQEGQIPRTRLPRKPNKLQNIRLNRRRRVPKTRKQALLYHVQDAVVFGPRVFYFDFGRRKGIFRVVGGARGFKRGWPRGAKLKMLWDLSNPTVNIPSTPMLAPAVTDSISRADYIYSRALAEQLSRRGLL